jgi:hypothetical protein
MQTPDQEQTPTAAGSTEPKPEAKSDEQQRKDNGGMNDKELAELTALNAANVPQKKKPTETKSPSATPAAAAPKKPDAGAATEKGSDVPNTKKKSKSKEAKKKIVKPAGSAAPKKKREAVAKEYPATSKKNPYREGSMKEKAFNIFAKGGERSKMIEAIVKLGATENTASSWIQFFRKYVATGKK